MSLVCHAAAVQAQSAPPLAEVDPVVDSLQIISTGHEWTEGPLWVGDQNGYLLFSDVPGNTIHRWDGHSTAVFLRPSGYAGTPIPSTIREGGSNGLALGRGGLLIADSGNRCVSAIDLETRQRTVLVDRYRGRRFNSPNDLLVANNGDIYFTDPPYGLAGVVDSPLRELTFTGVFRITPDNQVHLITDALFPNGIALSPDQRTLYATDRTGWIAIELDAQSQAARRSVLVASSSVGGGGDGMKTDASGNLWCSGPGGVHVFSRLGHPIGHIRVAGRTSNCAFGADGYIYITNAQQVVRGKISERFARIARTAGQ
ncbi:SMP-30/gluconolactonase/LRE family protein [Steroidobacter agaridevorans]|nr:SMP-30/gluconolactonase/LRE family protein [Steroidobacter agaridevorans]